MRRDANRNTPIPPPGGDDELLSPEVLEALRERPLTYPKAESTRRVMAAAERRLESALGAVVEEAGIDAPEPRPPRARMAALFGRARLQRSLAVAALLACGVVGWWVLVAGPGSETDPIALRAIIRVKDAQLSEADRLIGAVRNRMAERKAWLNMEAGLADDSGLDRLLSRARTRAKDLRQKAWVETNVPESPAKEPPGPKSSLGRERPEDLA